MARAGEAVCVDGLATRVQRPSGWVNQKVLYDAKRHAQTAQGLAVSTIWGDLMWCHGGWPGCCHEQELVELSGLREVLDASGVATLLDRGFRAMANTREHWHAPVGDRRTKDRLSHGQRAFNRCQVGLRALVEQLCGALAYGLLVAPDIDLEINGPPDIDAGFALARQWAHYSHVQQVRFTKELHTSHAPRTSSSRCARR
jgi:hypothetical protein